MGFFHSLDPPPTFLNFSKIAPKGAPKSAQNPLKSSKSPSFLKKMGGTQMSSKSASPVRTKYQKLFRRVIEVEKSEKIIKIDPETAEISKNSPEIAKIAKISNLDPILKITKFGLFRPFLGVFSISRPSLGRF